MSTIKKEVEVSKEADELAESIFKLVESSQKHTEDGFQAGQDLPAIIMENLQSLMTGIDGMDKMSAESKENIVAFINAWTLAGTKIAGLFISKPGE